MANDVLSVQSRVTERKSDLSSSRKNGIIPGFPNPIKHFKMN